MDAHNDITAADYEKAQSIGLREEAEEAVRERLGRQNREFVQVYKRGWKMLQGLLTDGHHGAAALWCLLAEHIDSQQGAVCASQKTLAQMLGCSERSVRRYLSVLVSENAVLVIRLSGSVSAYALDPSAVWRSWDAKKEGAAFLTKTLIGKKEAQAVRQNLRILMSEGDLPARKSRKEIRAEMVRLKTASASTGRDGA